MNDCILQLKIEDFEKCQNIWNQQKQAKLAQQFYEELSNGNRMTYVYTRDNEFIGEISLVFDMKDSDYTIEKQRIYVSRLLVKPDYRRQGIGRLLVNHVVEIAKQMNYKEMSIGVDLDNYPALKLYIEAGFDQIIFIGRDEQSEYMKLLKTL